MSSARRVQMGRDQGPAQAARGHRRAAALKAAPEVAGRALEVAAERVADLRNVVEGGRDAMVVRERASFGGS